MDIQGSTPSSSYTALSTIFALSYVFLFRHSLLGSGTTQLPASTALLRRVLTLLVIAHTVYTLRFLLSPPVNLFTLLDLPLTAPVSAIRVALLEKQKPNFAVGFQNKIREDVETLLSRLSSFEARVIYVKYGPYPLSYCVPCVHHSDFAIFALAPTVLPYLRTLILTSFITSRPAQRPAWRTPALVILAAAFFAEVWWTLDGTVEFRDGKVNGWTHTQTYTARTALLLILPLFAHHLPAHSALSPIPPFISLPPSAPLRPSFPHQASDFNLANANDSGAPPQTPRPNPAFASGTPSLGGILRSASTRASSSSYPFPGSSTFQSSTPPHANAGAIPPLNGIPAGAAHNSNAPPPPTLTPSTPFSTLNNTLSSLSTTLGALRVLEWARLAGMRKGEVRKKMDEYYATAEGDAMYVRGDATLRREAEKLGMGYREGRPPRFGGAGGAWRGGDPRGLDGDGGAFEDDGDGIMGGGLARPQRHRQRQQQDEDEEELARSPLRAKARKAVQEISQVYLLGMGGGRGEGSGEGMNEGQGKGKGKGNA